MKNLSPRLAHTLALLALLFFCIGNARAQQSDPIHITAYNIQANVAPQAHTLSATAQVTFTANQDLQTASFLLHGRLNITKIVDAQGNTLNGVRGAYDTLLITPSAPLVQGQTYTWTFTYSGNLNGGNGGPVPGLTLADINKSISYLLYGGAWFPMDGYLTDRFTADMQIAVPAGYTVLGSGPTGKPQITNGVATFNFKWDKPGFPGTILIGKWIDVPAPQAPNIHLYVTAAHKKAAQSAYGAAALDEFAYFSSTYGQPQSNQLNIVELPNNTVPAYWAPQIAAIAGSQIGGGTSFRLLANTIAHQWWSSAVSPATLNDAWITNGMCTYSELLYLEYQDGQGAMLTALKDISAGALAYDTTPLTSAGRLNAFSPQFQSMTFYKGAEVLHMLNWMLGDNTFTKILDAVTSQYAGKGVTTAEFESIAQKISGKDLTPFFAEWLDGTGAPNFTTKWTIFRLGNGKGFRTVGEIKQQLDLFNMPVDLRIETEGKTANRTIHVVGTSTPFNIETFGMPRKITVDPEGNILQDNPAMQIRVDILRGQQLAAQGDVAGALAQYQAALKVNPLSSLANFRIGELLFQQHDYQAAVNAYRASLHGDGVPAWTAVWSHIEIGKIFDVTGQRDRAIREYREALLTHDNTSGALNEARHDIQVPYKLPKA
jgi:tetratricopeptide (TPR) repeat protein